MSNLEKQYQLEFESVTLGEQRYQRRRQDTDESDTAPGRKWISTQLEPMTEEVRVLLEYKGRGKPSLFKQACESLQPEQAAFLSLRAIINGAAREQSLRNVCIRITQGLEDHLNASVLADTEPGIYKSILPNIRKWTVPEKKMYLVRNMMRRRELDVVQFADDERVLIGGPLVDIAVRLGLVELTEVRARRTKSEVVVRPTATLVDWLNRFHHDIALAHPAYLPMVTEPRPWTSPVEGGYLTGIRGANLIKLGKRAYLDDLDNADMPVVYEAVNHVQATPWQINTSLLDVVEQVLDSHSERFDAIVPPMEDYPLPEKPGWFDDLPVDQLREKEEFKAWKGSRARTYEANAKMKSRRIDMLAKVSLARKFKGEDAIYFPHHVDFRGRIYPIPPVLNPQADDLGRALLQFANGKPLGEEGGFWLAVHCANTFGNDKISFEDRAAWTQENSDLLVACAMSPMDESYWLEADKPWSFLAACKEWAGFMITGEDYVSHLPIHMDGSCSGLQHFSALLRDPRGGAAVNLAPADKPSDIYQAVADEVEDMLIEIDDPMARAWEGKVTRKIAKRPTMTTCYGATLIGMRGMIIKDVNELSRKAGRPYLGADVDVFQASQFLSRVIYEAIGRVVVAARTAMDWLQEVARVTAGADTPVLWTTPAGFPVRQEYNQMTGQRVKLFVAGERHRVTLTSRTKQLDKRKQASSISPNFVHSLDAAHLMLTMAACAEFGLDNVAVIHDSFGTHTSDTSLLHALLREEFIAMYQADILTRLKEQIEEQIDADLPALPPGDLGLDLEQIRESDFFFA